MSISDKLITIAENEQKVFDAGYKRGKQEGDYGKGVEDGKKAEYDNFWDNFQNYGTRRGYQYAFAYSYWNENIFKPKYNITPDDCSYMFNYNTSGMNLKTALENAGVKLDTSKTTTYIRMFYNCNIPEIPTIDLSSATNTERLFYSPNIIFSLHKTHTR